MGLLILCIAAVLVSRRPVVLAAEALVLATALTAFRGKRSIARLPRLLIFPLLLVALVGLVFYDPFTAASLALRFFNLLAVSSVFFSFLDADELGGALRQMGVPFGFTFILTTGMRYVPLMGRKVRSIREAQQARGIDLRPRLRNLPNLAALLVPLVVQSFVLADDLALAMESRGFRSRKRSASRTYRMRPAEAAMLAAAAGLLALLAWWEGG
jgi:energy-coupling factor transport system permease protein